VLWHNRVVSCVATTPDVVRMRVDGVGFMFGRERSAAHARIHLGRRDNSEETYTLSGEANRIDKVLAPNDGDRIIAYAGIACTVSPRNLTSVHDCRGTPDDRTCEVGLDYGGAHHAYLVSLSIKPIGKPALH
jgi:hypothetical protein